MQNIEDKYETYNSPTTKPNGVLYNKLGIDDIRELNRVERMITSYKLAQLFLNPTKGDFDMDHYLSIHKYLFDDIYPFAGQIRTETMSREKLLFCLPHLITFNLRDTLNKAKKEIPKITDREKLVKFITVLYSDLDIIHSFREGNGRTEREFIRQYVDYICKVNHLEPFYIDYQYLAERREEYINAVIKADALMQYEDLYMLFDTALSIKKEPQKKEL